MARLTQEQAKAVLIKPANATKIVDARNHEQRLQMHTEPILDFNFLPYDALRSFLNWVECLLPPQKFKKFQKVLLTPLDTVESTKSIFDELRKVFDAQDSFKRFDFVKPELTDDFLQYMERLKDNDFWITHGFAALKNAINSILIVDLPAKQVTDNPEPYYFLLKTNMLIDIELNELNGNVEYVAYSQKGNIAVVICDEFYRTFRKSPTDTDWMLVAENAHSIYDENGVFVSGLGYCPAEPFYKVYIGKPSNINKRAPLTDVLGKLDWLLFWRTSVKYFELYGAWPIIISFEEECHYQDNEGNKCLEGKVYHTTIDPTGNETQIGIDCPACKAKELIGPGSQWTVKAPRNKDAFNMMDKPAEILNVDAQLLQRAVDRIKELEDEIYLSVVGYDGDAMNNKAVNETQVAANFESKESVLDTIKTEFQRVQKFALDTVARLRYDKYFIKSVIDWGNEYFIKSLDQLNLELQNARNNGMPMFYIGNLRDRIIQTKSKNNPDEQKRNAVLIQLEPYPDLTLAQMQALQLNITDPVNYIIKLNFTTFIQRFERENMNIVQFGSLISFSDKINNINKILNVYGSEQLQKANAQPDTTGNAGVA